uniref:RRM domain-containing protein n=1 Tax=Astatotilapia calliptera TaxID=8154 RepID=A0AAX7W425_ASTCA
MEGDGSQATSGSLNDSQHDPGKMFIGGLSWQTSPDSLRDYFSKFGEIRECMVMRDPTTKRSRGFGFVTFTDAASVDKVLAQQHHELDSKTIDPKVAFPRRAQPKMVTRTKKIFVGGLSANTVVEDVKQYFEQFGKDTCTRRCRTRAAQILKDPSHPGNKLFQLLQSGRRFRIIRARTERLKRSFYPQAIRALNTHTRPLKSSIID